MPFETESLIGKTAVTTGEQGLAKGQLSCGEGKLDLYVFNFSFLFRSLLLDWHRPPSNENMILTLVITSRFIPFPHIWQVLFKGLMSSTTEDMKAFSYWYHLSCEKRGLAILLEKLHSSTKWKGGERRKFPCPCYTGLNLIHLNMNPMSKVDSHHMFFGLKWIKQIRKTPIELT